MPDSTVEPRTTVLLRGTQANYHNARADGTTELMGLICIPVRSTYANGWVACTTANWGSADKDSDMEVAIRELDMINPQTTIPYDKDAVTVAGDTIVLHYLIPGDEHWALVAATTSYGQRLHTSAVAGELAVSVTGTVDDYVHEWMVIGISTGAQSYSKVRYMGVFVGDITD